MVTIRVTLIGDEPTEHPAGWVDTTEVIPLTTAVCLPTARRNGGAEGPCKGLLCFINQFLVSRSAGKKKRSEQYRSNTSELEHGFTLSISELGLPTW